MTSPTKVVPWTSPTAPLRLTHDNTELEWVFVAKAVITVKIKNVNKSGVKIRSSCTMSRNPECYSRWRKPKILYILPVLSVIVGIDAIGRRKRRYQSRYQSPNFFVQFQVSHVLVIGNNEWESKESRP